MSSPTTCTLHFKFSTKFNSKNAREFKAPEKPLSITSGDRITWQTLIIIKKTMKIKKKLFFGCRRRVKSLPGLSRRLRDGNWRAVSHKNVKLFSSMEILCLHLMTSKSKKIKDFMQLDWWHEIGYLRIVGFCNGYMSWFFWKWELMRCRWD